MAIKGEQLQVRVSAAEKAAIRARARAAGVDVSTFVLRQLLPSLTSEFAQLVEQLGGAGELAPAIAAVEDFLVPLKRNAFREAVQDAPGLSRLTPLRQNVLAAMVEQGSTALRVAPPAWTASVAPLAAPWFATDLPSLRSYLIASSPVPFRRRNLFVESGLGARR